MNRLTRTEAAAYLGCGRYTLYRMEKEGLFSPGDYYTMGSKRLYITERLDEWMRQGGEEAARERKNQKVSRVQFG